VVLRGPEALLSGLVREPDGAAGRRQDAGGIVGEVGVGDADDREPGVEQPRVVLDVAPDGLLVGGELAAFPPRERELERLLPDEEVHDTHAAVSSPAVGVADPPEPLGGVDHALDAQRVGDAAVELLRRPGAEPFPDRTRILAARTDQVRMLGPARLERGDRLAARGTLPRACRA